MKREALTLVIPCYNEAGAISATVTGWAGELSRLGIVFDIRVYDDGSRDDSAAIVERLAAVDPRVALIRKSNEGHGPTVMRGYREAGSEWVFQTDGDGELQPDEFEALWRARDSFDVLVGIRTGRASTAGRRALTFCSRLVVRLLFGQKVTDVNSPYRLMRRAWLATVLPLIPADSLIPNVAISGLAARSGARVFELPVRHVNRRTGISSVRSFRLWKLAIKGALQVAVISTRHAPRWTVPDAS